MAKMKPWILLRWMKLSIKMLLAPAQLVWERGRLCYATFIYNEHTSFEYVMDTMLEPLFRLIDKGYVNYVGPVMVFLVITLTLSVIVILLLVMLPWYLQYKSWWLVAWHLPFGAYLFFSICFHYIQGLRTGPGYPPPDCSIPEAVALCKKCHGPKPPRTHHCSVCNRCILRMDHHCPWLNNCVGHYNHRYFFLFMAFMSFGSAYLCFFILPEFWELYFLPTNHPDVYEILKNATLSAGHVPENPIHLLHRTSVVYMFFLSGAASISVSCLMLWHASLISCGETSIEAHINKKERKRLQQVALPYFNPYNFGFVDNWKIVLGMQSDSFVSLLRHVFWFSAHKPEGNGLKWKTFLHHQYSQYMRFNHPNRL